MKAISLWEPWASLIASGHKTIETRSWRTPYRGPLAIHAAKKWDRELQYLSEQWPYAEFLRSAWEPARGCIVAVCTLAACRVMTTEGIADRQHAAFKAETDGDLTNQIALDYWLGDWKPGRYAWCLSRVVALPEPIPARGMQGIWDWEPPHGLAVEGDAS